MKKFAKGGKYLKVGSRETLSMAFDRRQFKARFYLKFYIRYLFYLMTDFLIRTIMFKTRNILLIRQKSA